MPEVPKSQPEFELVEFGWLERRADGLLLVLLVCLVLANLLIDSQIVGSPWQWAILAGALILGIPAGLMVGWFMGRGVAGGMFLPAAVRQTFLAVAVVALGVGVWLCI